MESLQTIIETKIVSVEENKIEDDKEIVLEKNKPTSKNQQNDENATVEDSNDETDPTKLNKKGECIIPWAIADVFVWTAAGLTCGICSVM